MASILVLVEAGRNSMYLQTYKIFSGAILQRRNLCGKTTFLLSPLEFKWKALRSPKNEFDEIIDLFHVFPPLGWCVPIICKFNSTTPK